MKLPLLLLSLSLSLLAQSWTPAHMLHELLGPLLPSQILQSVAGGTASPSGAVGPNLIAHSCQKSTSITLNTTGGSTALFKVITVTYLSVVGTVSDTGVNTYTPLTAQANSTLGVQKSYYALNATGTASDVFTASGFDFSDMCVDVWDRVVLSSALGVNSAAASSGAVSTLSAGSVTPAGGNNWLMLVVEQDTATASTKTIDSSYTILDQLGWDAAHFGVAVGWKWVTGGSPTNPTWTMTPAVASTATIWAFKTL